ncbi:MAG: FecCD family ABC transporter permease [bacterium]
MHLDHGKPPKEYVDYIGGKYIFLSLCFLALIALILFSISVGSVSIPLPAVIKTILGRGTNAQWNTIIWKIRLPRILAAVTAGTGLAVAGAAMQSILRNPLGSPFTLGISQAAAFGAALSVMIMGTGVMHSAGADSITITNPYLTAGMAFLFCLLATAFLLTIARLGRASPEVLVLAGVALGALFTAGTMFLQYFADDTQLAAMVFWTFGDVGRAGWNQLGIIAAVVIAGSIYFLLNSWNYNGLDTGDETARGLGIYVEKIRLISMVIASLVTAVIISFVGIIGFIGLVCPHMIRRIIGDDHRFLLPGSCLAGGIVLLAADTTARTVMAPKVFPVAILTAFLGVPVFLYLLIRGYR